jgi:hypothetical protein
MSNARSVRYRRLAIAEQDKAKADLLLKLADECDRGLPCTAERLWASLAAMIRSQKREASRRGQSGFVSPPTLTDDLEKLTTSR